MIYYFRHFLLYRTFSDIEATYPIRQNENAMYYIRQVCIISDIACIISDMHVLYPTCLYYIRHACTISDRYVLYPTLPILYPTPMYYIRHGLYYIRHPLWLTCPQNVKNSYLLLVQKQFFFPLMLILPLIFLPPILFPPYLLTENVIFLILTLPNLT